MTVGPYAARTHRLQSLVLCTGLEQRQHRYAECNTKASDLLASSLAAGYPCTDHKPLVVWGICHCVDRDPPLRGSGSGSGSGIVRNGLATCNGLLRAAVESDQWSCARDLGKWRCRLFATFPVSMKHLLPMWRTSSPSIGWRYSPLRSDGHYQTTCLFRCDARDMLRQLASCHCLDLSMGSRPSYRGPAH